MGTDTKQKTLRSTEVRIGLSVIGLLFAVLVGVVVMRFTGPGRLPAAQSAGASVDRGMLASGPSVSGDASSSALSSGPSQPTVLAAQENRDEAGGYAQTAASAADERHEHDASRWPAGDRRYASQIKVGGEPDSEGAPTSHADWAESQSAGTEWKDTSADSFERSASYTDNAGGEVVANENSNTDRGGQQQEFESAEAAQGGYQGAAVQPINSTSQPIGSTPESGEAGSYGAGQGVDNEPALNSAGNPTASNYRAELAPAQAVGAADQSFRQSEPAPYQSVDQRSISTYDSSFTPVAGGVQPSALQQDATTVRTAVRTDKTIVQPGDSLWTIARRVYGSGAFFKALQEHNRYRYPNTHDLKIGDEVLTPDVAELRKKYPGLCPRERKRGPGTPVMANVSTHLAAGRTYIVEEGDTLYDIARYELGAGGRWPEIYQLNSQTLGNDFDYLRPGTRLKLPAVEGGQRQDAVTQQPDSYLR